MKVVHVGLAYPPSPRAGGIATGMRMSASAAGADHNVTVVASGTFTHSGEARALAGSDGLDLVIVPTVQLRPRGSTVGLLIPTIAALRTIRRVISQADIVHLHGYRNGLVVAAALVARFSGARYVVQPHGSGQRIGARRTTKALFDRTVGRLVLGGARSILVLTDAESDQIARLRTNARRVHVFNPVPSGGTNRRRDGAPLNYLFVGRLNWKKGVDALVEQWRTATAEGRLVGCTLRIVGPDDGLGERIRSAASSETTIEVAGTSSGNALGAHYDWADVLVVPSMTDTLPVVILEAASHGLPSLVSIGVEATSWLEHDVFWFDPEVGGSFISFHENYAFSGDDALAMTKRLGDRLSSSELARTLSRVYEARPEDR